MTAAVDVLALVGPTGVGKTRVAVEVCRRLGGEIVGVDSVQVYRGFNAGSSKPSADELGGVRHHLIDILDPDERIDAASFAARADAAIREIRARGALPVLVGGTGLWCRALLRGLVDAPPVDPALRSALEREWDALGAEAMHRRLAEVDPRTAQQVHAHDRLRVVRALEVHAQTGLALGSLREAHRSGSPRYRTLGLFLDLERVHWREFIGARTRAMLARGWIEEVRGIVARHGESSRALRSVGYRQIAQHLGDGIALADLEASITRATLDYGRRQRVWFRRDPDVDERMTPDEVLGPTGVRRIEQWLQRS